MEPADLHARACRAAGGDIVGVIVPASLAQTAERTGTNVVETVEKLPEGMCLAVIDGDDGQRVVPFAWHPALSDTGCELLQTFWIEGLREDAFQAAQAVENGEH